MLEDTAELSLAAEAAHRNHSLNQFRRRIDPRARLALAEATIIHQLHLESAKRFGLGKHFGLYVARPVPGRLAARRRVHGEDQPALTTDRLYSRCPCDLIEER